MAKTTAKKEKKETKVKYTIPLRAAFDAKRNKRANKAVNIVNEFLLRHTKATEIKLDASLNETLWKRGIQKPPRRVTVEVVRDGDKVTASLA